MVSLPGSYPLDESAPATPDESVQHHQLGLHTRNKLQKPTEPGGYQQADSSIGVGLGAPLPHQSHQSREQDQSLRDASLDVAGSGDHYALNTAKPATGIAYEPVQNTAPQGTFGQTDAREIRSSDQPQHHDLHETAGSNKPENGSTAHNGSSDVPPYWGSLPKGQRGGIYNTVTGHGSPNDDYAQHHNIPEKSARSERTHIPGPIPGPHLTDHSSAGVYNTVAGHGSRDDETTRHTLHSAPSEGATIASTDAVHDAPLAGIPENSTLHSGSGSGLSATYIPTSDLGMGYIPEHEVSAQDDKLPARSEGPHLSPTSRLSLPPAQTHTLKPNVSGNSHGSDTMQQRAFPLGPSNMLSDEDSQKPLRSNDHRDAILAGVVAGAGMGTGIAASADHHQDEHEAKKEHRSTSPEDKDNHGRNRLSKVDKKNKIVGDEAVDSHHNGKDKHTHTSERSREDGSPKGEKKHHKILGIFSRHKDEKEPQDTSTTEPTKEHGRRHSGDKKKEPAVGAAAAGAGAVGAIGLMSRHKDEQDKMQQHNKHSMTRHESPPAGTLHEDFLHPHGNSQNVDQLGPGGSSGVVAGSTQRQVNRAKAPTTFDEISRGHQAESAAQVPNYSQPTNADRSRAAPIAAAGLSTAAGLGAYHATHSHDTSSASNAPQVQSTTMGPSPATGGVPPFENPRTAPDHLPTNPLAYTRVAGVDDTSATSDASKRQGVAVTNQPGNHNTLSSGTTSGVTADVLPTSGVAKDTTTRSESASNNSSAASGSYNVLASGTPSGVKVEPRSHHGSEDRSRKSGEYNALSSSGTASGINTEQFENRGPIPAPGGNRLSQPIPPPIPSGNRDGQANQHNSPGFVSVPITSRGARHSHDHYHGGHYNENRREETADLMRDMSPASASKSRDFSGGESTYNSNDAIADRMRHMSPEVLPAAYTASAPRPDQPQTHDAVADRMRRMSPEVLPAAYTASAPRPDKDAYQQSNTAAQTQAPTAYSRPSDVDPALAAANGAWASSGAPTVIGGTGWPAQHRGAGGKTVLHKCDHCGKDNDITSYLSQ